MMNSASRELFDLITGALTEANELKSRGVSDALAECSRAGNIGALVPKLIEMNVKSDKLAEALGHALNIPVFPSRFKPSAAPDVTSRFNDEDAPGIITMGEGFVFCTNSFVYLVNPLNERDVQRLLSEFEAAAKGYGVISNAKLIEMAQVADQQHRAQKEVERGAELRKPGFLGQILSGTARPVVDQNEHRAQERLDQLIRDAAQRNASDIHFDPGPREVTLKFRIDGELKLVERFHYDQYLQIANRVIAQAKGKPGSYIQALDGMFVFSLPGPRIIKLRVMMVPVVLPDREEMMPKLVLRLLGNRIEQMALTDLGIPDYERNDQITAIQLLCERKNGLILVSGPTGSGKTTTLSAVQREMLKTYPNRVYYTIEDPVEISIPNVNHVQVNQEAELTFSRGLKAFLRGDPDVIMVGEIRDMDAATQALTASITGHLVLSTIHTNSAIETAIRLIDMGCDSFIVSSALKAATAQRLVKRLCTECSMEASWDELTSGLHPVLNHRDNKLMRLRYTNAPKTYSDLDFYPEGRSVRIKGPGCSKCDGGIKGRALVSELFLMTPNVSQAIASKQSFATVHQIAVESGFKDLWQHAMYLIRTGVISFDDAVGDIGERDVLSPSEKKVFAGVTGPQDRAPLSVVGQQRNWPDLVNPDLHRASDCR